MKTIKPIIIAGPSGSGKDTLIKLIIQKYPFIHDALGYTTREPRAGEVNGRDINFVSKEEFENLIKNNELFEYSCYSGNYYGMPFSEIENAYSQITIFNIGISAAKKLQELDPSIITILVIPPTKEELLYRIGDRGIERYNHAIEDIELAKSFFENLVINYTNRANDAVSNIENIIFNDSHDYLLEDNCEILNNFFEKNKVKIKAIGINK